MTTKQDNDVEVLVYIQESNVTDPIQEQLDDIFQYIREELGYDLSEDLVDAATAQIPFQKDARSVVIDDWLCICYDTVTDADDNQSALRKFIWTARDHSIDHVVINSMGSLTGSIRDINNFVQTLTVMGNTSIHFINDDPVFTPTNHSQNQEEMRRVLNALDKFEASHARSHVMQEHLEQEETTKGRP